MATDASAHPDRSSVPTSSGRPILPRKFGRYALFDFIGRGGMAEIYLARAKTDLGVSRLCVVKQILPELASHKQFADMLIHEAKLAARLSHANVVQVFDLGRADDRLYIAMDYVEGFDLNDLLRRCSRAKQPLPFEFALHMVAGALRGLDYAHRRVDDANKPLGIVHRDVSPSNILLSLEGEVKLCDFGIARANDVAFGPDAMVDDAIKGKAGYMSPEHARGEAIDARADVFAAGIVLWELISGRRMYKADTGKPPLLEQARIAEIPELPKRSLPNEDSIHGIAYKALATKPDDRYPSAHAMLRDIEAYMGATRLVGSPIRFGEWLVDKFAQDIVEQRRARERAVEALERGAPVSLVPLPPAPTPLPSMMPPAPVSTPNIVSTPPATPVPPMLVGVKLPTIPPASTAPSSIAALDVSPPSSQVMAGTQPKSSSKLPLYIFIAFIALGAIATLVVFFLRRQ
jgi:serine/threonine-protein kinase